MKGLSGKVALVTGGGNGIGRATCLAFAEQDTRVILVDIDAEAGNETVNLIHQSGGKALFVQGDVAKESDIVNVVKCGIDEFSQINILVNCAATFIMKGIDAEVAEWNQILAVNVVAYALFAKYVVPEMKRVGGGAIVNVSSMSGFIAQPNFVTYSTTKGAIASMTRCMALDLAPFNIRVNAVSPGTVWTQANAEAFKRHSGLDRQQADQHPAIGGAHMLHRTADPQEIAEPILFLASDSASFITAENLVVDGGYGSKRIS